MPKRNVPPPPRVLRISQIPHSVFSFIIIQHAPLSVRAPWTASPSRTATPTATWFYMLPNTGSLVVSCNPGVDWSAPVALRMTLSISDLIAWKSRSNKSLRFTVPYDGEGCYEHLRFPCQWAASNKGALSAMQTIHQWLIAVSCRFRADKRTLQAIIPAISASAVIISGWKANLKALCLNF